MDRILNSQSYMLYVYRSKETGEYLDIDYNPTDDIDEAIGYRKLEDAQKEIQQFDEPENWYIVKKLTTITIIGEPIEIKQFI